MFTKIFNKEPNGLDLVINDLLTRLQTTDPTTEAYDELTTQLRKLVPLQTETNSKKRVSADAVLGAAATLIGILAIINHEHVGTITSKAMSFVPKLK